MIGLLLSRSLTIPVWLLLAVSVAFGGLQAKHVLQVRRLTNEIAAKASVITTLTATVATKSAAVVIAHGEARNLSRKIEEQNAAIEGLQAMMQAQSQASSLAAVRVLNQGEADAEALRQPTSKVPPGFQALNDWIAERVTR